MRNFHSWLAYIQLQNGKAESTKRKGRWRKIENSPQQVALLLWFHDSVSFGLYHPRLSRFSIQPSIHPSSLLATAYRHTYERLWSLFGFDFLLLGFRWKNHNKQECFFYRSPVGYCYLQTHLCIIWEKVKAKN